MPRRTALVTGASSGIGEAFADVFAERGFDVVLVARREARLRAVAERLERDRGARAHVVPADLAAPDAVASLRDEIERRGLAIDALVNAAGFGVAGRFADSAWPTYADMLRVMVAVPSELAHAVLPGMIERRWGRIVNVASVAGLVDQSAGAIYGAAKSYLVAFSTSLAREVRPHGVHVTAVCPGLTRTAFHDAPGNRATVTSMPGWMWMDADTVARQGFDGVTTGTPIVVNGRVNRLVVALLRTAPRPLVAALGRQVTRATRIVRRRAR